MEFFYEEVKAKQDKEVKAKQDEEIQVKQEDGVQKVRNSQAVKVMMKNRQRPPKLKEVNIDCMLN